LLIDSTIISNQLNSLKNDKILIGDNKPYNSKPLEEKVKNIQLGKLFLFSINNY